MADIKPLSKFETTHITFMAHLNESKVLQMSLKCVLSFSPY